MKNLTVSIIMLLFGGSCILYGQNPGQPSGQVPLQAQWPELTQVCGRECPHEHGQENGREHRQVQPSGQVPLQAQWQELTQVCGRECPHEHGQENGREHRQVQASGQVPLQAQWPEPAQVAGRTTAASTPQAAAGWPGATHAIDRPSADAVAGTLPEAAADGRTWEAEPIVSAALDEAPAADTLRGGQATGTLRDRHAADTLRGGQATGTLRDRPAADTLRSGPATDTLAAVSVTGVAPRVLAPVQSIGGEALRALASWSVADAVRYFSGVQIKDYGGIGGMKTVNIRSLGTQHTGIFYDGIRIENAQNGQVDLGRYSLDNLEQISVVNAQKTGTLQSASDYASAAAVYLTGRKPVFTGSDTNISARMKYGSFTTVSPSVRIERRLKGLALTAEGMYLHSDGDYPFRIQSQYEDTTSRRVNGDITAVRAEAGLHASPLGGDLQAHAYFYSSERGLPGPVVRRLSDQYASTDRQWDRNAFIQARWLRSGKRVSVLLNSKAASDLLIYESRQSVTGSDIRNEYLQRSLYLSAAGVWHAGEHFSANAAVDGRLSGLVCDVPHFSPVTRSDLKSVIALSARAGRFSAQASLLHTWIRDRREGGGASLSRLTPALLAGWSGERLSVRAFYKSIFRPPTLNDLYYTLVGNASLKPEYTEQWDIGCDALLCEGPEFSSRLSADLYLDRVRDKIVAVPVSSQFRWSMLNYGLVRGAGAELSSDSRLRLERGEAALVLSCSLQRARDCSSPDSHWYGGQIPYTPLAAGSALLSVTRGHWRSRLSLLYTGRRYRASDNAPVNMLKPWATVDAGLTRAFRLSGAAIEAGLDINNLLNTRYEVVSRYPMPGTSIQIKLNITI